MRGIAAIANSSMADHPSAVFWGQWCRELAERMQDRDEDEVIRLIEHGESLRDDNVSKYRKIPKQ